MMLEFSPKKHLGNVLRNACTEGRESTQEAVTALQSAFRFIVLILFILTFPVSYTLLYLSVSINYRWLVYKWKRKCENLVAHDQHQINWIYHQTRFIRRLADESQNSNAWLLNVSRDADFWIKRCLRRSKEHLEYERRHK